MGLDVNERLTDAESAAFDATFARYRTLVTFIVSRYFTNRSDTEDAIQETYLAAMRGWRGYHDQGHAKAWLSRVAHNVSRTIRTRRMKHEGSICLASDYPSDRQYEWMVEHEQYVRHDVAPSPAQLLEQLTCGEDWERVLSRLPPEQWETLRLIALDGCSYKETAQRLGVPLGTIRSRYARARQRVVSILLDDPSTKPEPPSVSVSLSLHQRAVLTFIADRGIPTERVIINRALVRRGLFRAGKDDNTAYGVKTVLRSLAARGLVTSDGHDRYSLTADGEEAARQLAVDQEQDAHV